MLILFCFSGPVAAETLPSTSYDLALSKGVHALGAGRYEEAARAFEMALSDKPGDTEAAYYLGMARRLLGRYTEAWELLTEVKTRQPGFLAVHLELGITAYHLGRYDVAASELLLAEAAEKESARKALNQYYLGLVFYKQEQFDKAAPRLLRAAGLSPELSASAHYLAGVALYRQGRTDEAKDSFEAAIRANPSTPAAESSRKFLDEMGGSGLKPRRWHLAATAAVQYDSNVILLPENTPTPTAISDESDVRSIGMLQARLRLFETGRFTGLADYSYYQSRHQDLGQFDVQNHDIGLTFGHAPSPRPYRFEFGYALSDAFVDGENYLRTQTGRWMMEVERKPSRQTRLEYRYQNKDFLESDLFPGNEERTGINHAVGISGRHFLSDRKGNVHWGYTYDRDITRGEDWDYQGHFINLGLELSAERLGGWADLILEAHGGLRRYDNPNSFSTETPRQEREDTEQIYTATVSRAMTRCFSGSVQYLYNKNVSNIEAFEYIREIVSVSLMFAF